MIVFIFSTLFASHELIAKKEPKDKIAEELYLKKDKPSELIKTIKRIGEITDSNKDFDTAIAYKDGKPAVGIKPKSGVPMKINIGAKFDNEERGRELRGFLLGDNSHFEFSKDELKKFEVVVGKTVVESAEEGKLVLDEVFPELPPMKLKTEHPVDKEYSCFDYIKFETKRIKDGFVYWDNEKQDKTVVIALAFNPSTGEAKFPIDFVKVNRKSKNYNIDHEIDFYEFQISLLRNAKLVFVNLNDNSIISKTDNFIPVNVDSSTSFRNMEVAVDLFKKIKRIQDYFKLKFVIPERISLQDLKDIEEIISAIDRKDQKFSFQKFDFEGRYDEAVNTVKNFKPDADFEILYNNSTIELFGQTIKLGKLKIKFPPCKIFPTLEELELIDDKTKPVTIILKPINKEAYFTGKYLDFIVEEKDGIQNSPNK